MVNRTRKPAVVSVSSSSASGSDEENSDDENCGSSNSSGNECELSDKDYDDDGEDEDDDDDDDDDDDGDEVGNDSGDDDDGEAEDAICDRIIGFLRDRSTLQELTLKECKAYLRRHGLRISGTKDECIKRIKEHWRLKDVNGETLYPRSSFTINCTGDVCRGDIVLFTQKVYDKFEKMKRTGKIIGRRTIAGRVVKESYGAAKQQHTFTVEVLWCKGAKRLPPLFPLLVKGRNLYKMRTFRQSWRNEAERSIVLDEKHQRGMVARQARAMRKERRTTERGLKCQKVYHGTMPLQELNRSARTNKKCSVSKGGASSSKISSSYHYQRPEITKQFPASGAKYFVPSQRPQQHFCEYRGSRPQMVHQFQAGHHRPQFPLHSHCTSDSYAPARLPHGMPYSGPMMIPSAEYYDFSRRASHLWPQMYNATPSYLGPRIDPYYWRSYPAYNGM